MSLPSQARQLDLDLVRTVAIFGTVLIHATAVGGFNWAFGSAAWAALARFKPNTASARQLIAPKSISPGS